MVCGQSINKSIIISQNKRLFLTRDPHECLCRWLARSFYSTNSSIAPLAPYIRKDLYQYRARFSSSVKGEASSVERPQGGVGSNSISSED